MVPIGEPHTPMSTGVRAHNKSLCLSNTRLGASDHDFHVVRLIPSVDFIIDIPAAAEDSFHKGLINVTVKDKVLGDSTKLWT